MTDIVTLARRRAHWSARYELLGPFEHSPDTQEREAFRAAKKGYLRAEQAYQQATATFTAEEIAAVTQHGRAA